MIRTIDDLDGIAGLDRSRGNRPEVCARSPSCSKDLRPALLPHPASEGRTGYPWHRHLQNDLLTNPPALTDTRIVDLKTRRRQVLAEETVRQFAAEPALPLVEIFTLEGIDRLIVAAVMLAVTDEIPDQPAAQSGGFSPGPRTSTGSLIGCLPIPVHPVSLYGLGSGRPILTESSRATQSGYVLSPAETS